LSVPGCRLPFAVPADWSITPDATPTEAIDLAAVLDLDVGAPQHETVCLRRGHEAVFVKAADPSSEVEVDRLVITPADDIAEIISFDGIEGLLVRPERLGD
jgi:hypothetical protein